MATACEDCLGDKCSAGHAAGVADLAAACVVAVDWPFGHTALAVAAVPDLPLSMINNKSDACVSLVLEHWGLDVGPCVLEIESE